ncbi:MAG: hypothetical protein K2I96_01425 [Lachnospiraceae bacterium]|nr:hypothetical protein [Lachnospiraceae bacterium]
MKTKLKKMICSILTCAITLSVISAAPALPVSAKESPGNGLTLSTDSITITAGTSATFTAVLGDGFDASQLACVVADPNVATITPITYAANAAAYQVSYENGGSTVAAIYHPDNPAVVAYVTINASLLVMEIPSRLGTNHDNYCTLVSYEFVPYDFKYADFSDYKSTLKLQYQCTSYKDDAYAKWGCYGYFYDAAGNVLSKVHLYCSTLSKGRVYNSEFNVPVNAVRFAVEGFN